MRAFIVTLFLAAGLMGLVAPAFAEGEPAPRRIAIASGPLGGSFYLAAGAICDRVNRRAAEHGLECLVLPGGSSEENLAKLAAGTVDFALVQSDWQYRARLTESTPNGRFAALRAVLSLHAWAVTLVAAPESGITQVSDLQGRRVSFGPGGASGDFAGQALMTLMGWQNSDFSEIVDMPVQELPAALCGGRIDAMILPLVHPDPMLTDLFKACEAELIDLSGAGLEKVSVAWPFLDRIALPAGVYSGQSQPLETFGLRAGLVTTAKEPAPVVAAVAEAVLQDFDSFKQSYPLLLDLTAKRALQAGITAPLHDGIEALVASGRLFP